MTAGYNAYYMAYSTGFFGVEHKPQRIDVPYKQNPERDLWLKGWAKAQKNHERGQQMRYEPFKNEVFPTDRKGKQQQRQKSQAEFKAKQKNRPQQQKRVPNRFKPAPPAPTGPVNLNRLTNRFSKKFKTAV